MAFSSLDIAQEYEAEIHPRQSMTSELLLRVSTVAELAELKNAVWAHDDRPKQRLSPGGRRVLPCPTNG
jgi:hypothetical protein